MLVCVAMTQDIQMKIYHRDGHWNIVCNSQNASPVAVQATKIMGFVSHPCCWGMAEQDPYRLVEELAPLLSGPYLTWPFYCPNFLPSAFH